MHPEPTLAAATAACPKRMHYGPCGSVLPGGGCEVTPSRCSFVDLVAAETLTALSFDVRDVEPAEGGDADALQQGSAPSALPELLARGNVITADLPVRTIDPAALADVAARLSALSAVIAGEPPGLDASLSPAHKALILSRNGVSVIAGLTCRDRNRVALEGELAALADIGVAGVLAVTGDHPITTVRRDAAGVFDLDSTRLAALSRRAGLFTAVAEQPAAPPVSYRPARLAMKVAAGAQACFLNLCGGVDAVRTFVTEARNAGAPVPIIAGVPILVSPDAVARIAALPGVVLPPGMTQTVADAGGDAAAGIEAAAALAAEMLAIPGVAGVHLTAIGTAADPFGIDAATVIASTAERLRERLGTAVAA